MNNITWKYVKPLVDPTAIERFESDHAVQFPLDLKEVLKAYNGGRPSLKYYDLGEIKDKEFKTLLSFNESDSETIYKAFKKIESNVHQTMIPFASDSAGNFFVVESDGICLWLHEIDKTVKICDSFTSFIAMLHG